MNSEKIMELCVNQNLAQVILDYIDVLIWPSFAVFFILFFSKQIKELVQRIKKANLPGNISFETFPEKLQDGKILADKSKEDFDKLPEKAYQKEDSSNQTNQDLISRGLRPSQSSLDFMYYENIARFDPNLALAGLRMEFEVMVENLITGFNLAEERKKRSIRQNLKFLLLKNAITTNQYDLGVIVLDLCNRAIHGASVSVEEAIEVIEIAKVLVLFYKSWIEWGFEDQPPFKS